MKSYKPVLNAGLCSLALVVLLSLVACNDEAQQQVVGPVAIQAGDECHVCGMIVNEFPGPKGEAIETENAAVRKFCSTRDLFAWWLQPENRYLNATLYVHDMARSDWQRPDDRHLIDARSAYYVLGSNLKGSMGSTLATLGTLDAAQKLVQEQGGEVLRFEDITLDTLHELMDMHH